MREGGCVILDADKNTHAHTHTCVVSHAPSLLHPILMNAATERERERASEILTTSGYRLEEKHRVV